MTVAGAKAELVGDSTQERYVAAGGQRIRVSIRPGSGVPLVLCNGIGAGWRYSIPWWHSWIRTPSWFGSTFRELASHRLHLCRTGFRTSRGCWAGC